MNHFLAIWDLGMEMIFR